MTELDLNDWQNRKYTTRDGREVRLAAVDGPGDFMIIGWLFNEDSEWVGHGWSLEGKSVTRDIISNDKHDLINAPEEPAFVPGSFWVVDPLGAYEMVTCLKPPIESTYARFIRIPPPDVIEAVRKSFMTDEDLTNPEYHSIKNFYSIDT